VDPDQTTKDAKRYRLLRDYLLSNGFVGFQETEEDDEPFVMDGDFYGPTFEDAVDALEKVSGSANNARAALHEVPKAEAQLSRANEQSAT
jgi:hypothetical protein